MNSRRERKALRNEKRKSVVIVAAISLVAIIAALCAVLLMSGNRDTTSIEEKIPSDASVVFLSDANEESWEYFSALTSMDTPFPPQAKELGFANVARIPTLYFSIDSSSKKETEEFLEANVIPYRVKDNVYAVTLDNDRLAEDGITHDPEYKKASSKGSNTSFGYVNFSKLELDEAPSEIGLLLPHAGVWSGEFKNDQWDGKLSDVDYSAIDPAQSLDAIAENVALGLFADEIDSKKGRNSVTGNFNVSEINSLLKDKYTTSIQKVDFEIKGERLTFTLG